MKLEKKPIKKPTTINLDQGLLDALKKKLKKTNHTLTEFFTEAAKQHLNEK